MMETSVMGDGPRDAVDERGHGGAPRRRHPKAEVLRRRGLLRRELGAEIPQLARRGRYYTAALIG